MGAGMPQTNPWKTLSSRIAYSNPWMSVREDEVIRPDGNPGIYGVIETRIATGVVALTPDGEVYLIGAHITPLTAASTHVSADPTRSRKLLLHAEEIRQLIGKVERAGYTLVPLDLH